MAELFAWIGGAIVGFLVGAIVVGGLMFKVVLAVIQGKFVAGLAGRMFDSIKGSQVTQEVTTRATHAIAERVRRYGDKSSRD
jgi:hypothetical protein